MSIKKIADLVIEKINILTVSQWKKIDEDYKTEDYFDIKAIFVFVTATIVLIITKYFCKFHSVKLFFPSLYSYFFTFSHPLLCLKLYWAVSSSLVYFLLPAIVIKFIFKEKIKDYGFYFEKKPKILLLYLGMFLIVIPLVYAVSFSPEFLKKYPFYKQAADSFWQLVFWETGYGMQFFMLEFFFRGFLLFTLARYIGAYAIFVMVLPYTMIHFTKPLLETIGAIFTGIALGTLALRTRSIYGGIIIHTAVAWCMDLLSLFQKGQLQKLFKQ